MSNRGGNIAAARCDGEGTGQYWTVAAHLARDVESRRLGFAMVTVRSDDNRSRIVGIRMEPCNCEVAALMGGFCSRTRLIAARRARPRHSH